MSGDDGAWLLDMLLACEKIERFTRGLDGAAFLGDELPQEAILRQLTARATAGVEQRGLPKALEEDGAVAYAMTYR